MKWLVIFFVALFFSEATFALPPAVELDRLLLQAKSALDAKDYAQATESLSKAEKLGVKLPATFYYHYGLAYAGTGQLEKGHSMLEKYLELSGTKGKFYREALEELNKIEAAIKARDAKADRNAKKMADFMLAKNAQKGELDHCYHLAELSAKNWEQSCKQAEADCQNNHDKCYDPHHGWTYFEDMERICAKSYTVLDDKRDACDRKWKEPKKPELE